MQTMFLLDVIYDNSRELWKAKIFYEQKMFCKLILFPICIISNKDFKKKTLKLESANFFNLFFLILK